jgi:hypothetical protein
LARVSDCIPVGHSGQRRLQEVVGSMEADHGFPMINDFRNILLNRKPVSTTIRLVTF